MINIESHLEKLGVSLTAQLINDIQNKLIERKGADGNFQSVVNASGKLAKSIRYEVTNGTVLSFYGNDYIEFLQNGRRPGKVPFDKSSTRYGVKTRGKNKGQPRGDFSVLSEWMENKPQAQSRFGWSGLSDAEKSGLIYAIAQKQKDEGSTIYRAGGSDLVSGIFNEALQRSIEAEFAQLLVTEIRSDIFGLAA